LRNIFDDEHRVYSLQKQKQNYEEKIFKYTAKYERIVREIEAKFGVFNSDDKFEDKMLPGQHSHLAEKLEEQKSLP